MLRLVLSVLVLAVLSLLVGCSDLGFADCTDGGCGTDCGGVNDPPPETLTIGLGCTTDADTTIRLMGWDLIVDPIGTIEGDESFAATFSGVFRMDESVLDEGQAAVGGGYKRSNVLDLKATVHVRDGITSEARDVVLTVPPGGETCAFDENGHAGRNAGPMFPPCSPAQDVKGGGNNDCIGLGNGPDPRNPCGQFVTLPTSDDSDECAARNKAGQFKRLGFCTTGDLEIPLEGAPEAYIAASAGEVLFGWDDQSTDAVLDTTRPDDPVWILARPEFDAETGPNGFRIRIGYDASGNSIPIAFECTMASGTPDRLRPALDEELLPFEIQAPCPIDGGRQ